MTDMQKPFGKYFLQEKIALGGMAEIYKAKTFGSDGFEKTVVIKKVLSHWALDPEFIRMLVDEAKLCVLLNHPNIVQVFDLGNVDQDYYIAMEYVEGLDLKSMMNQIAEKTEQMPPAIACYIALQTAAGLDYAHHKEHNGEKLEIIHRDISPHNILLSINGEVKITDFGIAKAAQKRSFTQTGTLKGKLHYMSPEQVRGEKLTAQSDVFSLGLVLYEMLTGKKCFTGETEFEILEKIRQAQIKREELPSHIPEVLKDILVKALSPNLSERYSSAEEFQVDLAKALNQLQVGFLPKNLAEFIKQFSLKTPLAESKTFQTALHPQVSHTQNIESQNQSKSSSNPLPSPPAVNSKKSSSWIWVLLGVLVFFCACTVLGYMVWLKVISPRLQGTKQFLQTTSPSLPSLPTLPVPQVNQTHSASPESVPQTQAAPETQNHSSQASQGQAYIVSTPDAASVYLNDKDTGLKTPALLTGLEIGKAHRIRLTKTGYYTLEAVFNPSSSQMQTLNLPLMALSTNPQTSHPSPQAKPKPKPVRNSNGNSGNSNGQPLRQTAPPKSPNLNLW